MLVNVKHGSSLQLIIPVSQQLRIQTALKALFPYSWICMSPQPLEGREMASGCSGQTMDGVEYGAAM